MELIINIIDGDICWWGGLMLGWIKIDGDFYKELLRDEYKFVLLSEVNKEINNS